MHISLDQQFKRPNTHHSNNLFIFNSTRSSQNASKFTTKSLLAKYSKQIKISSHICVSFTFCCVTENQSPKNINRSQSLNINIVILSEERRPAKNLIRNPCNKVCTLPATQHQFCIIFTTFDRLLIYNYSEDAAETKWN